MPEIEIQINDHYWQRLQLLTKDAHENNRSQPSLFGSAPVISDEEEAKIRRDILARTKNAHEAMEAYERARYPNGCPAGNIPFACEVINMRDPANIKKSSMSREEEEARIVEGGEDPILIDQLVGEIQGVDRFGNKIENMKAFMGKNYQSPVKYEDKNSDVLTEPNRRSRYILGQSGKPEQHEIST